MLAKDHENVSPGVGRYREWLEGAGQGWGGGGSEGQELRPLGCDSLLFLPSWSKGTCLLATLLSYLRSDNQLTVLMES